MNAPRKHCRGLILLLLVGVAGMRLLQAQLTDEQKREMFLENHGSSTSSTPKPTPHSTPHATPHKKHPSSHGSKTTHHHLSSPEATPHPAPQVSEETARPSPTPHAVESASHAGENPAHQTETPPTAPAPATILPPSSLPHGANPSAPITIVKSGVEQAQGLEPAQENAPPGLFGWLFGGGTHRTYNYLSASTRAAIDRAPVRHGRWKYIIVHNSGTREGNARIFDIYHLRVRHMKNGLAYHFVIGDGHGSGDGEIEIGHRWTAQLNGGHVASDYLNDISLGICLVGDFNRDLPTKAQLGALEELIDYLRNRVGKSQGRRAIIYAHKEINPRPTDCPGDRFPYSWLHARFR